MDWGRAREPGEQFGYSISFPAFYLSHVGLTGMADPYVWYWTFLGILVPAWGYVGACLALGEILGDISDLHACLARS